MKTAYCPVGPSTDLSGASVLEEDRLSVEKIYRGNGDPLATPSEILLTTCRQQMKAAAAELGWHRW